jgi:voltage-gated potassium channel Kch
MARERSKQRMAASDTPVTRPKPGAPGDKPIPEPPEPTVRQRLRYRFDATMSRGPIALVAEIQDPANLEAARLVGGDETVLIDKRETIARLIVQTSRQSGASVVYTELFDFDGDEIYFSEDPGLVGRTFGEALFAYEDCTVIGLRRAQGGVKVNPPADTPIAPGDMVIAIAEDDSRLEAAQPMVATVDEAAIVAAPRRPEPPQRVLIVGWNQRSVTVIRELESYVAPGSAVTVVADHPGVEAELDDVRPGLANLQLAFRRGNTTDRATLETLDLGSYDHAIAMPYSDDLDAQRADARTLITLLHLRDIAAGLDRRVSIVSEMLDDGNRQLAQVTEVDDVIVSDKILSLVLAQISENAELADVFEDLLDAEGSEIYMRPVAEYVALGRETSFATVVEAARRRDEAAIGLRFAHSSHDPEASYGVVVNPAKSRRFTPEPDDRIVVLAED